MTNGEYEKKNYRLIVKRKFYKGLKQKNDIFIISKTYLTLFKGHKY